MNVRHLAAVLITLGIAHPTFADDKMMHPGPAGAQTMEMAEGTIKKVDAAKGRVTIAHGPLKNLNMPPMTMVFRADSALLEKLAAGDKVRFVAEDQQGKMVVTTIEKAQ